MKENGKHIVYENWAGKHEMKISIGKYGNGNIALELLSYDEEYGYYEPYATATVNLGKLGKNYAFIDVNNSSFVVELMEKYDLGKPTGLVNQSGYCTYPLYELNMKEINKYKM